MGPFALWVATPVLPGDFSELMIRSLETDGCTFVMEAASLRLTEPAIFTKVTKDRTETSRSTLEYRVQEKAAS